MVQRPSTSAPSDGSRTMTIESLVFDTDSPSDENEIVGVLRLRGGPRRNRRRVVWGEDVVDNEGCGKKKSKICCIYHRPRRFDESSDEDSSSGSDSDSPCENGGHFPHHHRHHHHHHHMRPPHNGGLQMRGGQDNGMVDVIEAKDEPNAYEKMPSPKEKGKGRAE